MDHDIRTLYFDVAGKPMTATAFREAYPARVLVHRTEAMRATVCTEFVGINHNQSAKGMPWIYETVATVNVEGFQVSRSFMWSGGFLRARCWHWLACTFALFGGVLWWRYCAYRGAGDDSDDGVQDEVG